MVLVEVCNSDKQILYHLDTKVGTAKTFIELSGSATLFNYIYLHSKRPRQFSLFSNKNKVLRHVLPKLQIINLHYFWKLEPLNQLLMWLAKMNLRMIHLLAS